MFRLCLSSGGQMGGERRAREGKEADFENSIVGDNLEKS